MKIIAKETVSHLFIIPLAVPSYLAGLLKLQKVLFHRTSTPNCSPE